MSGIFRLACMTERGHLWRLLAPWKISTAVTWMPPAAGEVRMRNYN
jgi:hypothetical protein